MARRPPSSDDKSTRKDRAAKKALGTRLAQAGRFNRRQPMVRVMQKMYIKPVAVAQTIEQLLAQGWEIAGYTGGFDNRTALILYRHPGVNALVQCSTLYDVTRTPRTVVNCYELR